MVYKLFRELYVFQYILSLESWMVWLQGYATVYISYHIAVQGILLKSPRYFYKYSEFNRNVSIAYILIRNDGVIW